MQNGQTQFHNNLMLVKLPKADIVFSMLFLKKTLLFLGLQLEVWKPQYTNYDDLVTIHWRPLALTATCVTNCPQLY